MAWISTNPLPAPKFQSIREDAVTRSAACVKSHLGVQGAKTGGHLPCREFDLWLSCDLRAKALDTPPSIWHVLALNFAGSRFAVSKSFFAIVAAAFSIVAVSTGAAHSGTYPLGDEPYRLDWGYDPQIQAGCLKWNWQQYQWEDHCPVYVYPKAYMYPRFPHAVLRTKG